MALRFTPNSVAVGGGFHHQPFEVDALSGIPGAGAGYQ
jgi:hypothetical protein